MILKLIIWLEGKYQECYSKISNNGVFGMVYVLIENVCNGVGYIKGMYNDRNQAIDELEKNYRRHINNFRIKAMTNAEISSIGESKYIN